MSSVSRLNNRELVLLAEKLREKEKARRNLLERLILGEAENGGFSLSNVWRNEKLHRYSFREILARCKELEDQGRLQWLPDGRYVPSEINAPDESR